MYVCVYIILHIQNNIAITAVALLGVSVGMSMH